MTHVTVPRTWNAAGIAETVGARLVTGDPGAQRLALDGPAGTGKTRSLRNLALRAIAQDGPSAVALTSFTRNAVRGLRQFLIGDGIDESLARTLHSWCARLLHVGRPDEETVEGQLVGPYLDLDDQEHREAFVREVMPERAARSARTPVALSDDPYLQLDGFSRLRLCTVDEAFAALRAGRRGLDPGRARAVSRRYREFRRRHELLDYTDLLEMARDEAPPLGAIYVFCDEAQDWAPLEWAVLDAIAADARVVVAAGDAAQAIYGYKGARTREFLSFGGARVQLDVCYRMPSRLVSINNLLAKRDPALASRAPVRAANEGGTFAYLRRLSDLSWSAQDYLLLARNRRFLPRIERDLERLFVPFYGRCGGGLQDEGRIHDALLVIRDLSRGDFVTLGDLRRLRRAVGRKLWTGDAMESTTDGTFPVEALASLGAVADLVDAVTANEPWRVLDVPPRRREYLRGVAASHGADALTGTVRVRVDTIHASKGSEAAVVILVQDWSRASHRELTESHAGQEDRVAHVAASRASRMLLLLPWRTRLRYPFPQPKRWMPKGGDADAIVPDLPL